ncbi:MAG: hypothetical protein FJ317_03680 [SAR202 cluster bacterium]|nr:hypothetical protein [SAR202 cluster bacterium]
MSREQDEARLLFELLKARYGHLLKPDQLEEVRKGAEQVAATSQELRAVKLGENDGPGIVFEPYRKGR